jgi:two-component system CheB/CheR fusion protein
MARKKKPPPKPAAKEIARRGAPQPVPVASAPATAEAPQTPSPEPRPGGPPIAAIGASAGGLDAFKKFFSAMPPDSGVAFILVPHLDPTHRSLMVELIARQTSMPVEQAEDKVRVEANHVYIIPPNKYMTIHGGVLTLTGPVQRHQSTTPIDIFLRSLAEDQHERAICIILSGTGSHGSLGLRAIKAAGGMAMVQDPNTAEYDRMPHSAVATGLADFVLPPETLPEALVKYVKHYYVNGGTREPPDEAPDYLAKILTFLRARTKHDFDCYRKKMLTRRIERRMGLNQIEDMAAYLRFLRDHPEEIKQLTRDFFISVTSFFRDPEALAPLESDVIPNIVNGKQPNDPIRIWVPGCASGEEAYTLGILFLEELARTGKKCMLQIFATDVAEEVLEVGRHGIYPDSIADDVSAERLRRFFACVDEHNYQVNKQLRDAAIFAAQNVVADPPFSKLDLVSCRNMLIYLEPDVQQKIIGLLHFALNEGGYLLLGVSETVGRHANLFEAVDKKARIFRRIGPSRPHEIERSSGPRRPRGWAARPPAEAAERPRPLRYGDLTAHLLLERYAPAAVLVNRGGDVLYYRGATTKYLETPSGEPTQNLLLLARSGLRSKLRSALHQAMHENVPVTKRGVRIRRNGDRTNVVFTVQPVQSPQAPAGLLLVTFQDEPAGATAEPGPAAEPEPDLERQFDSELTAAREDLQRGVEELESSNEELKAANEEVMSMNEELQSANEELETSKEEMQSLNEELTTVNSQLQEKVADLESANNDLDNLFSSTDVATVFLDRHLRVKRFTPASTRFLNLIDTDVGRPLGDITSRFTDTNLVRDCGEVLRTLVPQEGQLQTHDGRWCLRRILPYRTKADKIDGVVVTLTDVTALRGAAERAEFLAAVLLNSADAIIVQDLEGRISAWNRGAQRMYGYTEAEAIGLRVEQLVPKEQYTLVAEMSEQLRKGASVDSYESQRLRQDGTLVDVWITVTALKDAQDKPYAFATMERDITQRKQAEADYKKLNVELERRVAERTAEYEEVNRQLQEDLRQRLLSQEALGTSEARFRSLAETSNQAIISSDHTGKIIYCNPAVEHIFGHKCADLIGKSLTVLMPVRYHQSYTQGLARYLATGEGRMVGQTAELVARRLNGEEFPVELSLSTWPTPEGPSFTAMMRDVSSRKKLEREVLEVSALEQRRIGQDLHDSVGQELTGLGLALENVAESLNEKHGPEANAVKKLGGSVRRVLAQVRALSRGLMPVETDVTGLMTALGDLAARISEPGVARCVLHCPQPVNVESNVTATHLYRIAQEAVTNALKHGKAKNIEIDLRHHNRHVFLQVRDDGQGMPADSTYHGLGLRIMRYRAGLINAVLTIDSAPGGGTVITCALPREGGGGGLEA